MDRRERAALDDHITGRYGEDQFRDLVEVRFGYDGEYEAFCRECGRVVGLKPVKDDAHYAAARHLARVHSGLLP